jgi:hypothetical protein
MILPGVAEPGMVAIRHSADMVGGGLRVINPTNADVRKCIAAGQPHREAGGDGRSDPKASVDRLTRCASC